MKRGGERTFECTIALKVRVTASGYYDQGVTWAKPEDCYPPEGECNIDRVQVCAIPDGDLSVGDLDSAATEAIEIAFYEALGEVYGEH